MSLHRLPSSPALWLDKSPPAPLANSLAPLLSAARGSEALALALMDRQRGLTLARALESPQLSALRKADPGGVAEALGNVLTFTASQLNVVRNFSEVQVAVLVNDLLERYWSWKLDEMIYVCREGIAGRWGKLFDRLDASVVHEWCQVYSQEREQLLADCAERDAQQHKCAEQSTRSILLPKEQAFWQELEELSDAQLAHGIAYYEQHPEQPAAGRKRELAAQLLAERWKLRLLKNAVPPWQEDEPSPEAPSEEAYRRILAQWVQERAFRRAAEEPYQEDDPRDPPTDS